MVLPSRGESPEVLHPRKESFDLPAALIATQGPAILSRDLSIPSVWRNQRDASGLEEIAIERIRVVGLVTDQKLGLHVEKSAVESFFDEGDFSW